METKGTERKDIAGDLVDVVDVSKNRIKVLFACSGNLDRVGDILSETALSKAKAPVPLMWRHFLDQLPLGEVERIERRDRDDLPAEVRVAYPDVTGGWVAHARVYQSDRGRELLQILQDGFVGGASFGYKVNQSRSGKTRSGKAGRVLEDISLYEVSVLELGGQANLAAMTIKSPAQQQRDVKELLEWYEETVEAPRQREVKELLAWGKELIEGPRRREALRRRQKVWQLRQELAQIFSK